MKKFSSTYILLILWIIIVSACTQNNTKLYKDLTDAEECMWKQPEKALKILQDINKDSIADKLNYATWCLLYTQAQDRNYITHSSDSLISIALDFFMKQDNPKRKAEAWFYKGQVKADQKLIKEAIECYVIAKEWSEKIEDPILKSRIHRTLGSTYRYRRLFDSSLTEIKKSIYDLGSLPPCSEYSYSYSELGRTYAETEKTDSAFYFFNLSLNNALLIKDSLCIATALQEIGLIYSIQKKYNDALENIQKSAQIMKNINPDKLPQIYSSIGRCYYYLGILDSSQLYYEKALNTSNLHTIRNTYNVLSIICEEKNDFKNALNYKNKYNFYNDSIIQLANTAEIAAIQKKYDNAQLLSQKYKKEKIFLYIIISTIIIISILVVLYLRNKAKSKKVIRSYQEKNNLLLNNIMLNERLIDEKKEIINSLLSKDNTTNNIDIIEKTTEEIKVLQEDNNRIQNIISNNINDNISNSAKDEQIKNLRLNNHRLTSYIHENNTILKSIKSKPYYIQDYKPIISITDGIYQDFSKRLKITFPLLTERDIIICCLIKLNFDNKQIAVMEGVEPSSISKKKQRIWNRIKKYYPDWNKGGKDLDAFIEEWG